jgi:mRNA interferase MazF
VWLSDLGIAAKVRPCLVLTDPPADDELALITVVHHTTALQGNRWELSIPKLFLKPGAFHFQQINTVSIVRLIRRLGELDNSDMGQVHAMLRSRLGC